MKILRATLQALQSKLLKIRGNYITPEGVLNDNDSDYVDVGVFGEKDDKETELYLKKHKISSINNKVTIVVDEEPIEVGIDPYNKLIDTNSDDNRKKINPIL